MKEIKRNQIKLIKLKRRRGYNWNRIDGNPYVEGEEPNKLIFQFCTLDDKNPFYKK